MMLDNRALVPLEGVPPAGELLKPMVDPVNARAMRAELEARAALIAGKLPGNRISVWLQLRIMRWRVRRLRRVLVDGGYRQAQANYAEARQGCLAARDADDAAAERRWAERGRAAAMTLKALRPAAAAHDELLHRIKAHQRACEWEREDAANRAAFRREVMTWARQIDSTFRQNMRLHHIHQLADGKTRMDVPQIQRVYVKEDKVLYHVRTSYQGALQRLTDRWANALPYNVDVADLVSEVTLQNLSAACRRPVTVEWSKRGTNLFYCISRLDSSDGIPNRVLYSKVIEFYPTERHGKTPWAAGITANRKVQWFDFEDAPHILIAGSTKSGKSNHVNQMIASLVTLNSPDELRLMLIDLKGGIEFTHWAGLRHELRPMVKNSSEVVDALRWLRGVMERRLAMFEQIKAKNLESFNKKSARRLPRLICLVDEMATLIGLGELTTDIHNELRVLSSQGRAVGINLVLCTQHSSVDVLPGWVKTNMGLRISGKMPSISASQVVLDSVSAANLPNIPGRLVFSVGRFEIIAQSPYISDDEVARAVSISQGYPEPDNAEFLDGAQIEVKPTFGREDALRIIMDQMGGLVAASRLFETVNDQNVLTLRQARALIDSLLLEIGASELLYDGRQYRLKKEGRGHRLIRIEREAERERAAAGD